MVREEMVYINAEYMNEMIKAAGKTKDGLSQEMGFGRSYLNNAQARNKMQKLSAKYLCAVMNGDYEKLTTMPKVKERKPVGNETDTAEIIVSYIQDVGKINSDIVREIRELRQQEHEEFMKVSAALTETLSLLRSMATDNRNIHTTINNKLVEMNNRMTSGK